MNLAKATGKLKEQISVFSGKLSGGLPKVGRRFVEEAVYGIQARQSVRLTEIARSLSDTVPLIKTVNRLSRQLGRSDLWEKLTRGILGLAADGVVEDTLLVVDISDISKAYAKRMEYLGLVYDGSTGSVTDGYWTCQVIACETGQSRIIPLYNRLYSSEAPDFAGETGEIKRAIGLVSGYSRGRGIWVIDRGGDRRGLFDYLLESKRRFIVRLKGNRTLIHKDQRLLARDLAERCFLPYSDVIVREEKSMEKSYEISYGFCKAYLPDMPIPLYLVVVRGFGEEPMMLLTNVVMRKNRSVLRWAVESYITRWKIEETIRFMKQSYKLEDIRVLSYSRLQNMMALVLAAAYFAAVYIGRRLKLKLLTATVLRVSKRIFGIPDFRYYALADGIKELLSRNTKGPFKLIDDDSPRPQLALFSP